MKENQVYFQLRAILNFCVRTTTKKMCFLGILGMGYEEGINGKFMSHLLNFNWQKSEKFSFFKIIFF